MNEVHKYQIELVTIKDIKDFVENISKVKGKVLLVDGNGMCVNAKSIVGVVAALEWSSLYVVSECEIQSEIGKYCV